MAAESQPRFLVLRPFSDCGLANRLNSIRAAFFFALVSRRAFFIDWGFMYNQPTKSEGLGPNLFDWRKSAMDAAIRQYEQQSNSTLTSMELCQKASHRFPCNGPNSVSSVDSFFAPSRSTDDIFQPNIQIIYLMMWNQQHYDKMWAHPGFAVEANRIGILKKEFFEPWWDKCSFRILFRPEKNVAATFCKNAKVWMAQKLPLVSLHIRTNDRRADIDLRNEEQSLERFIKCAHGISSAFRDIQRDPEQVELFPGLSKFDPGSWVVGADRQNIINHVKRMAPNITIYSNSANTRQHTGLHKNVQSTGGPLLDLLMLSHVPFGIGSLKSSFTRLEWVIGMLPSEQTIVLPTSFIKLFLIKHNPELEKELKSLDPLLLHPYQICYQKADHAVHTSLSAFLENTATPFIECSENIKNISHQQNYT